LILTPDFVREINLYGADPEAQQLMLRFEVEKTIRALQGVKSRLEHVLAESGDEILEEEEDDAEDIPVEIARAVATEDVEALLEWLGYDPSSLVIIPATRINAKRRSSNADRSLLYFATHTRRLKVMRLLLQMGAIVDSLDCYGATPLAHACCFKRIPKKRLDCC
jgi:hypothetical protein